MADEQSKDGADEGQCQQVAGSACERVSPHLPGERSEGRSRAPRLSTGAYREDCRLELARRTVDA